MTCFFCKGEMKPSTTIHTVQLKNCVVVIKNVPCMKCEQCGEVVLSADTIEKIEHILQTVEKAVAEITVVNFPKRSTPLFWYKGVLRFCFLLFSVVKITDLWYSYRRQKPESR